MFDSLVDAVTSMSALLTEPLDAYLSAFQWETHGNEQPYLFHPSDDTTRCLPSSQWTSVVKACFKKHSPGHVAPPPKLLRARLVRKWSFSHARHFALTFSACVLGSFITWLRNSTDAPEVLKAAAKAMRHKEATQQSDTYDKASVRRADHRNSRLRVASTYPDATGSIFSSAARPAHIRGDWLPRKVRRIARW